MFCEPFSNFRRTVMNKQDIPSLRTYVFLGIAFLIGLPLTVSCGLTGPPIEVQTEYQDWVATAQPIDVDNIKERYPQLKGVLMTAREWWEYQKRRDEVSRLSSREGATQFTIQEGTRVSIEVPGEEKLTREVVVDPDGAISLPYVGRVFVKGLSFDEARKKIERKLEQFLREPQVVLNLASESVGRRGGFRDRIRAGDITVVGKSRSGTIPFTGNEDLVKVIGLTGWLDESAEIRGIKVFVPQEGKTQSKIVVADLHRYFKYGDQTQNIELGPNYVVYVPMRWTAGKQINKDLNVLTNFLGQSRQLDGLIQYFEDIIPERE